MRLRLKSLEQELVDVAKEDMDVMLKEISKTLKTTHQSK